MKHDKLIQNHRVFNTHEEYVQALVELIEDFKQYESQVPVKKAKHEELRAAMKKTYELAGSILGDEFFCDESPIYKYLVWTKPLKAFKKKMMDKQYRKCWFYLGRHIRPYAEAEGLNSDPLKSKTQKRNEWKELLGSWCWIEHERV